MPASRTFVNAPTCDAVTRSAAGAVRREALRCIPGAAGKDSKGGPWVRWLTWIRKVKGTTACQESSDRALRWRCALADATFGTRAMPSEGIQGDEWTTYVPLDTYSGDEHGIAYRTRALWRRRPRSNRRSHDLPGRTGEPR
jgi:hypothetical protein